MDIPFPGMDPYLEHSLLWPGFHNGLMYCMLAQLQPLLKPRYLAKLEERVYLEGPEQQTIPDISVSKRPESGGVALAEPQTDTPLIVEDFPLEMHESFIEIIDLYNQHRLVTVIELLSPSNKRGGIGRRAYLAKRRETLKKAVHLVEIDLLRRGRHTVRVPLRRLSATVESYQYLACVTRWPQRRKYEVYPWRLLDRLPRLRIPLADPDPHVPLDLRPALERVYQDGSYLQRVKYDEPCEPPLPPADQAWATQQWQAYKAAHPELFPSSSQASADGA
jgi:hypothetical protein